MSNPYTGPVLLNHECRNMEALYPGCAKTNFHYHERCLPEEPVIKITATDGNVRKGSGSDNDGGPYEPVGANAQLAACTWVEVPSQGSVTWERVGNSASGGGIKKSSLGEVRRLHVGTAIGGPPGSNPGGGRQDFPLTFTAIDLHVVEGADASEATIIEGPGCVGTDHSGLNTFLAQAAAIDVTDEGYETTFSGRLVDGPGGPQVTFWNYHSSPIPIGTTALLGASTGDLIMVDPGDCITYYDDGSYNTEICRSGIPALSGWGLIVMTLLFVTAGTLVFYMRRRPARA